MRFSLPSSVRRLLPASDYCWACGNQIVEYSSDNETVLGSSRKLGGAAEHLIDLSSHVIERRSKLSKSIIFNVFETEEFRM